VPVPGFDLPEDPDRQVLFGPDRVRELADVLRAVGRLRPLVICSWRRRRSEDFAQLAAGLGVTPRSFEGVEANVPAGLVEPTWEVAAAAEADVLVSFGGGSAMDLAKAVVNRAAEERVDISHVAVPTTYSGAVATSRFWVSEGQEPTEAAGRPPDAVVLDPGLTTRLPWKPTAATGAAALAHCWEAITSDDPSAPWAPDALRALLRSLPAAVERPGDAAARGDLLAASYAAGLARERMPSGLHDLLCHALGARAGVPYGVANAVLLPHSMRAFGPAGVPELDDVAALIRDLRLPVRLREVGVFEEDLAAVASWSAGRSRRPQEDAEVLLRAAW